MMVDLHIHTYFSDGTMSPEEVARDAYKKGLKVIAVTDHNNIEAYDRLKKSCEEYGIIAIRGVEIDCKYKDKVLHVLAYDFKDDKNLFDLINKSRNELLKTSVDLIDRMSKDFNEVSSEDYANYEYDRRKGAWKGVHYLLEKGLSQKLLDGLKYYKEYGCDYIEYDFSPIEKVCKAIKDAGGYAVLAHPSNFYSEFSKEGLIKVLEDLKDKGIDGIECYYPSNGEELTKTCVEFCKKNDMIITAGSDGHGEFTKTIKNIDYYIGAVKANIDDLNLRFIKR
ncbi:PHP domain-containing protein [Romboutsia sp.]|uniref:PHP domain-containing protein n=1 Tax=Romboutsia sp. TaxID=1965302 RepID=UPI003F2FB147